MLKNVIGYLKRAGDHPSTVDCTSKLHSSTLGSKVWGKGDCGPFESPLRRSNLGLLQSIQYRYRLLYTVQCRATQRVLDGNSSDSEGAYTSLYWPNKLLMLWLLSRSNSTSDRTLALPIQRNMTDHRLTMLQRSQTCHQLISALRKCLKLLKC